MILAVDLAFFNYFVIRPPTTEAKAQAIGTMASSLRADTGNGRFIIYDPDQFETTQLYELGQTDLNTFASFPSGQGYTALTGSDYFNATGAHFQEDLNPATLAGPTWDDLNVTVLLSLPGYFLTPLGDSRKDDSSAPRRVQFPASINTYNSSPTPVAKTFDLSGGHPHTWYFGSVLGLRSATVPVLTGGAGDLRAGLVTPTGGVDWLPASDVLGAASGGRSTLQISLARPVSSAGIVVQAQNGGQVTLGTPTASTTETGAVALNGRMQYGVTPSHWVFTGTLGSFGVFHNTQARGWAWVGDAGAARSAGAGARVGARAGTVLAAPPSDNGDQQITVRTTSPTVLTRSESWSTGWKATVQSVRSSPGHRRPEQPGMCRCSRSGSNKRSTCRDRASTW